MENHRGPVVYYLGAILIFFAPWSVVIGPTIWNAVKSSKESDDRREQRFLLLWVFTYLIFFSLAATKLPNYIGPLYPALALLTASFLHRWANGSLPVARWVMPTAASGLAFMGVTVAVGLLIVGGTILTNTKGVRILPDLAPWAALGLLPLVGAVAMVVFLKQQQPDRAAGTIAVVAVTFVALLAAVAAPIVDAAKAPKALVAESGAKQLDRDIRLASFDYTQESVTFYAERRVERLASAEAAAEFLAMPRPAYLFVPAKLWEEQLAALAGPHHIAARHYDLYRNAEILVVTNDGAMP
jgi:4-amino-4-deoxy-L-arabinose transferase-like glycosyltransferase